MYEGYNFFFVIFRFVKRIAVLKFVIVMLIFNVILFYSKFAVYIVDWVLGSESQSFEDKNEVRSGVKLVIVVFSNVMESFS